MLNPNVRLVAEGSQPMRIIHMPQRWQSRFPVPDGWRPRPSASQGNRKTPLDETAIPTLAWRSSWWFDDRPGSAEKISIGAQPLGPSRRGERRLVNVVKAF